MKIYTKTGDEGQTGLFSGRRVSKADLRVEAYGTVDELNAVVGLLRDQLPTKQQQRVFLLRQQLCLFDLGALLADDRGDSPLRFSADAATELEKAIDDLQQQLPPLRHFVLPGGHPQVSFAHLARTVCRRAERRVVALAAVCDLPKEIVIYLNRLSDFFFVLSRYLSYENGVEELKWQP